MVDIGADGGVRIPPEVLEALEIEPGGKVRLFVDTRRKSLRIERHSDDPWADALKPKSQKDFEDLLDAQKDRDEQARRVFEKRVKETPPAKRKPEDDPDLWR